MDVDILTAKAVHLVLVFVILFFLQLVIQIFFSLLISFSTERDLSIASFAFTTTHPRRLRRKDDNHNHRYYMWCNAVLNRFQSPKDLFQRIGWALTRFINHAGEDSPMMVIKDRPQTLGELSAVSSIALSLHLSILFTKQPFAIYLHHAVYF